MPVAEERVYTLADLEQPRWRQILRRVVDGKNERFALGALAIVGAVLAVSEGQQAYQCSVLRARLLSAQRAEASGSTPAELGLSERVICAAEELSQTGGEDFVAPRLRGGGGRGLGQQTGVYVRLLDTEARRSDDARLGAEISVKDAVGMCLLRGEAAGAADPRLLDGACGPGSACLGEQTARLHNLRTVARGLSVLLPDFAEHVAEATSPKVLSLLEADFEERREALIPLARQVAKEASYALVVIDETPKDKPPHPWGWTRLDVQAAAHVARVALVDARTGEPLVRLRRALDAPGLSVASASASDEVRRQVESCALGLEVRRALGDDAS